MNITSQSILNPRSRYACFVSLLTHSSIPIAKSKIRLNNRRSVTNQKRVYKRQYSFKMDNSKEVVFNMIQCPSGYFFMGSNDVSDGSPKRIVTIKRPFLLGDSEVTQELYESVIGLNHSHFKDADIPNANKRPVECVTWYDAIFFCNELSLKLNMKPYYKILISKRERKNNIVEALVTINSDAEGFRLPSSVEWEYAAKAGTDNKYSGCNHKDELKNFAWLSNNSEFKTQPIKHKLPNKWGFYDMIGNVQEWCCDKRNNYFYVIRGGRYADTIGNVSNSFEILELASVTYTTIGFRIALPIGASNLRHNPKNKKKKAVIIKGNPYFMQGDYKEKYDKFYDDIKNILINIGYDEVILDDGEEGTVPPHANLWVAHSRGKGRLRFAPNDTKTLVLDDYEASNKDYDRELSLIKKQLGVTNMSDIPLSLRPIPRENHYTVNTKMRKALENLKP